MSGYAERCKDAPMENLIVGIISLVLFVYLLVAMIRPEKF
jgi:K+-transporting ATPase KdpF subunit